MAVSRPFLLIFPPFFRCSLRLGARNPGSGTKRPGVGSATAENGAPKAWSPPFLKGARAVQDYWMTSNGILDATYHPKFDNASMQTLANMNADVQLLVALPGDNLPIPDTAPRLMNNYADAPTKLETSLWISNYGAAAIEGATLTWSLTGSAVNGSTVHVCDRTLALNGSIAQGPTSLVAVDPAISCALPDLGETPVAPPGPPPLPPRPMPSGPGWIGPRKLEPKPSYSSLKTSNSGPKTSNRIPNPHAQPQKLEA